MYKADHDLLFGILALQNGLIDHVDLLSAFQLWSKDRSQSLGHILVDRGAMVEDDRSMIESLVARHIAKHGGDAEKSLKAVAGFSAATASLRTIVDPDLEATLAHLSDLATVPSDFLAGASIDLEATRSLDERVSGSGSGRFRILRPHARGGIGTVSVALDSDLHREVALKEIQDDHADDPQSRQRFLLEAEITGRLEHPGVVPVYALGANGKGRPYYAMRFVRGESLKEAINAFHKPDANPGRDPAERAVALRTLLGRFVDVCNAISYAHSRGVLHRDIKPANILLGPYGETLVVDWGLAKVVGREDPAASLEATIRPTSIAGSGSSETQAGTAVGTPAYMSPEQAEGRVETLGPATDVYSLGATLYVLLAGKSPFAGLPIAEVLRAVQIGAFEPPGRLNRRVPKALEAVVLKAMANRPADRYESAVALATDVELWLADEAVSAWQEPLRVRARRWASRRQTLVTAAVGAIILAAVASTAAAWFTTQALARESRALAEMTRAKAEEDRALAQSMSDANAAYNAVDTFLTRAGNELQYIPGAQQARLRLLEGAASYFELRSSYSAGMDFRGPAAAIYRVAQIRRELGQDDQALRALKKARELYLKLAISNSEQQWQMVGNTYLESGLVFWGQSHFSEALADFDAAIDANTRALNAPRPVVVTQDGRSIDGVGYLVRVKNDLASSYNDRGLVLKDLGRLDEARESYMKSLALRREIVEKHPKFVTFVTNLGSSYLNLGLLESSLGHASEAIAAYRESLRHREEALTLAPEATNIGQEEAYSRAELASALARFGKDGEAGREFEKAIATFQKLVESDPGVVRLRHWQACAWLDHAQLLARRGDDSEVVRELTLAVSSVDALQKLQPMSTDYRAVVVRALPLLASALSRLGRYPEALTAARRGVSESESLLKAGENPANRDRLARAKLSLGELQANKGETREAGIATLRESVIEAKQAVQSVPGIPWFSETLGSSRAAVARALRAQGKNSEAITTFDEAIESMKKASANVPEAAWLEQDLARLINERVALKSAGSGNATSASDGR